MSNRKLGFVVVLMLVFSISSCELFNKGSRSNNNGDVTFEAADLTKYDTCNSTSDCEEGNCLVSLHICITVGYEQAQAIDTQMLQFNCQSDADCETSSVVVQAGAGKGEVVAGEGKGTSGAGEGKDITINYYCDMTTHTCKPKALAPVGKG